MQKTISTHIRIDESIYQMIGQIAIQRKISKKRIIEEAVKNFWGKSNIKEDIDFFQNSFGVWKRDESVEEIVNKARTAFNQSMERHLGKE
jgi:hypothetical protein